MGCFCELLQSFPIVSLTNNEHNISSLRSDINRTTTKSNLQSIISSWPALSSDMAFQCSTTFNAMGINIDRNVLHLNKFKLKSLLVAADSIGRLHCFLDGSYYLGSVSLDLGCIPISVFKNPSAPAVFVQAEYKFAAESRSTTLIPFVVRLPLLQCDTTRRVAKNSTAARDLVQYMIKIIQEMRRLWNGDDGIPGAKAFNAKWLHGLYEKQVQFGRKPFTPVGCVD